LHLNDANGYRECCTRALKRFGETEDPILAANLVWTCSLAPGATADPGQIVQLADDAIFRNSDTYVLPRRPGAMFDPEEVMQRADSMRTRKAENYVLWRAMGAALYRDGKFLEAVKRFNAVLPLREQPDPSVWLFLALAHQRLKQPEEAKKWLDKAREWVEEAQRQKPGEGGDKNALSWHKLPWNERLAITLLRREAENGTQP
jgi:tetratricopeptide (TPR) repeat protein